MKTVITFVVIVFMLLISYRAHAYSDLNYPYKYAQCRTNPVPDGVSGFFKSHCTSYVAYMLNRYSVNFKNMYLLTHWGDAGKWDDAAGNVAGQNISVDGNPLPGDVAYWNSIYENDLYGHVAWVEKVKYDSDGKAVSVHITEYNYKECVWGEREISVNNPDGYIHILAYNEGVTSLYYLDCYESGNLCGNQTHQEWEWIVDRVWRDYRCIDCTSNYDQAFINTIATGFGGGRSLSGVTSSPDFLVNKAWLEDTTGNIKTVYNPGEQIKMKARFKNVGSNSPSDITVKFYLSKGEKVDANKQQVGIDNIHAYNMESGETHTEEEGITAPAVKGTYNITACADTENAVIEDHEHNNCGEIVFQVDDFKWLVPIINLILD